MASTYYVSQQRNDATHDGSQAHPFVTLAQLQAAMGGAGDTAYVGPGVYRERYTFQANTQSLIGDPLGIQTLDAPGRVRITGCDASEVPSAGDVISSNSKTGLTVSGYSIDHPLFVDGSSDLYAVGAVVAAFLTGSYLVLSGYNGANYCTLSNCISMATVTNFYRCNCTNCIAIGGGQGFYCNTTAACTVSWVNCLAIGSVYGFRAISTTNIATQLNCMAVGCNYAFCGESRGSTITTCMSLMCQYASYGTNATYPLVIGGVSHACSAFASRGGGYDSGSAVAVGIVKFDMPAIIRSLQPILNTGVDGLGTDAGAPDNDILGRARANPPDIGAFETVDTVGRWGNLLGRMVNAQ